MFMNHRDQCVYQADHVFSREDLGQVTAQDIVDWFNYKAFGKILPSLGKFAQSLPEFQWRSVLSLYQATRLLCTWKMSPNLIVKGIHKVQHRLL